MRRIGHMGAHLIAPGNTVASFEAAADAGVDMIEFDVLPERPDGTGELFLAHTYEDLAARRATVLTLDEGLDHLCGTGLELDVDVKLPGYEDRVAEAIVGRGYADRVLLSTMEEATLRRTRAIAPEIRLGWSVPKVRRNPFSSPLTAVPAAAMIPALRRWLPRHVLPALRAGRCEAIMCNVHLVTPRLVRLVDGAGGEVYVWTVDDAVRIEKLRAMGVAGVISNDPRLFAAA
jgi:glycerophosphoryl diester phosphodiesterase